MRFFSSIRSAISVLFRRDEVEREIEEELRQHLSNRAADLVRSGLPREEAERRARVEFGGYEKYKEEVRESLGAHWIESLLQDLRFALRTFVRNRAFFFFTVFVLALGIGANTAMFTIAYNVLLRPLPYRDAGRLVMVWEDDSAVGFPQNTPSPGNYAAWKSQSNAFTGMAAYTGRKFNFTGGANPEQFAGMQITANLFPLLGVKPALGRDFSPAEDKPGGNHVAVLSHGLWMANFGADPKIIGRQISLNDASYTVVGVMPRGFIFDSRTIQIWTPIGFSEADLANHDSHFLHVVARLKPGVSLETANADLKVIARRLEQQFPSTNAKEGAFAQPLRDRLAGNSRVASLVLLSAVGFVLLIACANVANLLLARATSRRKEIAMRLALGASRRRIAFQLLTESIVLSLVAGGAGLLLALSATPLLARLVPRGLSPVAGTGMNAEVLIFLAGISLLCGVLFGLAPALRISRLDLVTAFRQSGQQSGGASGTRMRDLLVVAEVALAVVLFSGAALLLRSLVNVRDLDPGFNPAHVLALETELTSPKYSEVARRNEFFEQALARIRRLPGVVAAGCTTFLPLTNWGGAGAIVIEGRANPAPGHAMVPNLRMISDQYMQAIGMRLMEGRGFNAGDGASTPKVALINQAAARAFWPGEDPLGRRFQRDESTPQPRITIVGIVADVRQAGLDLPARPEIYFPYQQWDYFRPSYFAVRTTGDPMALASAVREQIWAVDRDQPVTGVMPLSRMLEDYLAPRELESSLLGSFAGFALLLAALGIYAVLAFSVAQRTREIGIRVALGAQRSDILRQIVSEGLRLSGWGVLLGLAGALALGRLIASMLFGVSATDPLTLLLAVCVLLVISMAACYVPAMRAMRVDPMVALRYE